MGACSLCCCMVVCLRSGKRPCTGGRPRPRPSELAIWPMVGWPTIEEPTGNFGSKGCGVPTMPGFCGTLMPPIVLPMGKGLLRDTRGIFAGGSQSSGGSYNTQKNINTPLSHSSTSTGSIKLYLILFGSVLLLTRHKMSGEFTLLVIFKRTVGALMESWSTF